MPVLVSGTILHLTDLHVDMSASALERVAELALDLEYDLCVLTGDYRGRCTATTSPASTASRACGKCCTLTSMRCLEITISLAMVPSSGCDCGLPRLTLLLTRGAGLATGGVLSAPGTGRS